MAVFSAGSTEGRIIGANAGYDENGLPIRSTQKLKDGDVIVLAGKGHEDYQEIKGAKYHMDEREIIADILKE